jgi:OmpA-OmpF porin, OOP family
MQRKALLCVMALATAPAFADDTGHWYVTPQAGRLWSDNDRTIEDHDWLFGLGIGKHLSEQWSLELNANTAQLDAPPGIDVDFNAVSLDLLRVFARDRAVSPYITFGMGALETDVSPGDSNTDFMVQAGVGLMWRLWQNDSGTRTFSLRPEVKARRDDVGREGHYTDYLGLLGFQFSFGAARATPPPPPVVAAPVAAPAPTAAPPASPPPADSDGDGVLDPADRCPGTTRGVAVDADGCPRKGSITLEGVAFEVNSAQLTAESRPLLARVAADLAKYPSLRVEMQGHTDSSGADEYNMKLSERRAQAVRDYLVSQGVPARQVDARGYGETQPVADNSTAEGRARNRRVVMDVLDNPGQVEVEGEQKL